MKRKVITILIFTMYAVCCTAQSYNQQWHFGNGGCINFNTVPPSGLTGSAIITPEGSASVTDKNTGLLLFYTDGNTVWNVNHAVMPNGTGLLGGVPAAVNPNNPLSSTSAAVIVPKPFSTTLFYIATLDQEDSDKGLRYTLVDMSLNGGLGDVVSSEKNVLISNIQSEKMQVVPAAGGCGYWLIAHEGAGNRFLVFKIDQLGINTTPVISTAGLAQQNGRGHIKVNRQVNRIAMGYQSFSGSRVELFNFNATTGSVTSNLSWAFNFPFTGVSFFGVEFSPDGQKLYIADYVRVVQYDLSSSIAAQIESSAVNLSQVSNFTLNMGALQLGPDNRIYLATNPVARINSPNNAGISCDLQSNAISNAQGEARLGLPQWIYDLKPEVPANGIGYSGSCAGDNYAFSFTSSSGIQSVQWDFGDPGSGAANSSTLLTPEHLYFTAGVYNVSATITYACTTVVINRQVDVAAFVVPVFDIDSSICKGSMPAALPTVSSNGITGSWQPALNDTITTTYTFIPSGGSCALSTTVTIRVEAAVVPLFDSIPAFCTGTVAPLLSSTSLNGITGSWSPALIDNTSSGIYTFTPDANQCTGDAVVQLQTTVTNNDTVNAITFNNVCQYSIVQFGLADTQSVSGVNWTFGEPLLGINNIATGLNPLHIYSSSGTYTVSATISGGCAPYTIDTVIQIQPTVLLSFSIGNTFLTGQPVPALPATSTNGVPGTWFPPVIDNTASGSYTFTPSIPGCYADSILYIFIVNEIVPTFTPIIIICAGVTPPVLPTTSLNGITGSWVPAVVSNTSSGTYTFTPDAGQGAIETTMYIEVTAAPPSVELASSPGTDSQSVCINQSITNIVYSLGGPAIGATVTGLPPGIAASISGSVLTLFGFPVESINSPYAYTIITTGGNCGADTITGVINVGNGRIPVFNPIPAFCIGAVPPVLPDTSANGVPGTWTPAVVNNTLSGTYTFTPAAVQCGTASSVDIAITVLPNVVPVFDSIPAFCRGAAVPVLPVVSTNGVSGSWSPAIVDNTSSGNYVFTPAAGQCAASVILSVTVSSPTTGADTIAICPAKLPYSWNGNVYNAAGAYSDTLVNVAGCDSVVTLLLTVNTAVSSTTSIAICSNQLPYSWNGNVYNAEGIYFDTLVNVAGCDSVVTLVLTVNSSVTSATSIAICPNQLPFSWNGNVYNSAGTYVDTFINAAGCDSIVSLSLTLQSPDSTLETVNRCAGGLPYFWNGNSYSTYGRYRLVLTSVNGCDSIAALELLPATIAVKPLLTGDTNLCSGSVLTLNPGSYARYLWQDGSTNSFFTVTGAGNYQVKVTDVNGCSDSASVQIQLVQNCNDIYFPNAFTPDGNQLNDEFGPLGNLSAIGFYSLRIFNRYGQVVFFSNNPSQKWNGKYKSVGSMGNSFVWLAEYSYRGGIKRVKKGNVLLIR